VIKSCVQDLSNQLGEQVIVLSWYGSYGKVASSSRFDLSILAVQTVNLFWLFPVKVY